MEYFSIAHSAINLVLIAVLWYEIGLRRGAKDSAVRRGTSLTLINQVGEAKKESRIELAPDAGADEVNALGRALAEFMDTYRVYQHETHGRVS